MLKNRAIRLSLRDRIYDMLIGPDAEVGWENAWNVYNEDDFRQVATNGQVVAGGAPQEPFVYLLDSFLQPVEGIDISIMQPQVVFETDRVVGHLNELGNRDGRLVYAQIHIFGKNRAERDDLAAYFQDYLGALQIKEYSAANPDGTVVETAFMIEDRLVEDVYTSRADVLFSGFILDWSRYSFSFITQQ